MSEDEAIAVLVMLGVFTVNLSFFFTAIFRHVSLRPGPGPWPWMGAAWTVAVAGLFVLLRTRSSFDVQDSPTYLFFYLLMGIAWTSLAMKLLRFYDWRFAEDVLEQRNFAAALAQGGGILGIMAAFAGGNIGDGPGWWVVLFCAFLATAALLLAGWGAFLLTGWSYEITVERHAGAGLLAGIFLVAAGVMAGRSVAGNWVSLEETFLDFCGLIWPLAVLTPLAAGLHKAAKFSAGRRLYGILTAALAGVLLLAFALAFLGWAGEIQ